jgi:TRAP-type C4-dicarboxylate transport system substrate-binding protein
MIEALGGTPVGLPPGAVYENAEKGVIDGAVFTWDTMASFKLAEVIKHHLDARLCHHLLVPDEPEEPRRLAR